MKNTGTGKVSESLNIHQSDGAKKYISSIITVYNTCTENNNEQSIKNT